jgi:iron complex outermembrane receptor protein
LSLEQLMNVEVTVASRSEQKLFDAPAAVYVISGDELRRQGFTNVQEALRMVPGFYVARWTSNMWDVTARGFSRGFANQLLVMIDGINVYTPLFAGVWWQLQEIDMADVERIEVVRGPGASLWGQNAVNGIVNVVTKHASETQGWRADTTLGDEERRVAGRYGGKLGDDDYFRTWLVASDHDPLVDSNGDPADFEDWQIGKAGFECDWNLDGGDRLRLLGNAYSARIGEEYFSALPAPPYITFVRDHTPKTGVNLLASWEHPSGAATLDKVTATYSRDNQKQVDFQLKIDSFDLEWQRRAPLTDDNIVTFGLGYHFIASDLPGDFTYTFDPDHNTTYTARAFIQDEILVPAHDLKFVLGAEVENNEYTQNEIQPSVRAIWTPKETQALWAAVSRAVRTPSIEENYLRYRIPTATPGDFLIYTGSESVDPEDLIAYEVGWRTQATDSVALDTTAFYNDYSNMVTREPGPVYTQGGINYTPLVFDNMGKSQAWGVEIAADWVATTNWHLRAAYTFFEQNNQLESAGNDAGYKRIDHSFPENQANLRSYLDLGDHWELDAGVYYVDSVPYLSNDAYIRTDVRLGYNPTPNWRFSLGVQNALKARHAEEGQGQVGIGSEVERNVYVNLSWSQ